MGKKSLLWVWQDGWVWVVFRLKQCKGLVGHVHDELAHFGIDNKLIVYSKHNNGGGITIIHGFSKGPS